MDDDVKLCKPKGSPDLIKLDILGSTVLVDHEQGKVLPLSEATCSAEAVIKYLVAEGFLVPVEENESPGKEENN